MKKQFKENLRDENLDLLEDADSSYNEIASGIQNAKKCEYTTEYILKSLIEGKTRDQLALEFNHKSYKTIDMYMRRHGFVWDGKIQNYMLKAIQSRRNEEYYSNSKVKRIISLFDAGLEPKEVAKRVGMKDHKAMAAYMKSKEYMWSFDKQNYVLNKGLQNENEFDYGENKLDCNEENSINNLDICNDADSDVSFDTSSNISRMEKLLPMLEMIDKNKDKLAELLSINTSNTIPRYVIGGITITKSLCMSHPLSELVKEFSKEFNLSQKEIFEVAIVEFLNKYGYENEVNSLFTS